MSLTIFDMEHKEQCEESRTMTGEELARELSHDAYKMNEKERHG